MTTDTPAHRKAPDVTAYLLADELLSTIAAPTAANTALDAVIGLDRRIADAGGEHTMLVAALTVAAQTIWNLYPTDPQARRDAVMAGTAVCIAMFTE